MEDTRTTIVECCIEEYGQMGEDVDLQTKRYRLGIDKLEKEHEVNHV